MFGKSVAIYEQFMKGLKELDFLDLVRNNKEIFMKFFVFNENEKITFNDFELIGNGSTAQFFHKFVKEETQETLLALSPLCPLSGEEIYSAVCEGKLVMQTSAESYKLFKLNLLNVKNADGGAPSTLCRIDFIFA